jgi:DNA mismatch endonuclease (patch repair protein)
MADVVTKEKRSSMMAGIKGKNTRPEISIRKELYGRGYRYKLHSKDLPGKPDLVFPKYKAVVFVHGCFWHRHKCHLFKWPSTRLDFWEDKINGNAHRDEEHKHQLLAMGWKIIIVWECAVKGKSRQSLPKVADLIISALNSSTNFTEITGYQNTCPDYHNILPE